MTIDGEIEVQGDEAALLRELVAWLASRGASYAGWISAFDDVDDGRDIEGTYDWEELKAWAAR